MKKAGADKKRARRSSGRDPATDISPKKQANKKDVFQLFAEKVRDHKDLVSRWAVLQETRVEYFRGKDFVSFLRNHSELKDILESDRHLEVEDIVNVLLSKNLLVRCDRVVKTVRPGKRKLSTWPAHLEIYPEQEFSDTDAFFAWTFVNKRPLWQTLLSLSWPVLTLAICLFPVYPHQAKLLILYSCAGVLLLILCLLLVRALIFGASWILLGRRIWIFPNILAEEATLRELFRFWPKKDEEEKPKLTARFFFAIVAVLAILLLRHHAPDEAARARYQKRVSNIIDDVLEWDPRLALSGMMDSMQSDVNGTDTNNVTEGSSEKAAMPNDFAEHEHDDVTEKKETRLQLLHELHNIDRMKSMELFQKARIKWDIELAESNELERRVTSDEIKKAVWDYGSDKALEAFVTELFATAKVPIGYNSSFITLILKTMSLANFGLEKNGEAGFKSVYVLLVPLFLSMEVLLLNFPLRGDYVEGGGGFDFGSLKAFNLDLFQKWRWCLVSNPNLLWVQVIKAIHGDEVGLTHFESKNKGVWSNITETINHLHSKSIIPSNNLSYKVGCGSQVVNGFGVTPPNGP
nr:translocation protein SEC62-like [Tanacetum cinerariifolium]